MKVFCYHLGFAPLPSKPAAAAPAPAATAAPAAVAVAAADGPSPPKQAKPPPTHPKANGNGLSVPMTGLVLFFLTNYCRLYYFTLVCIALFAAATKVSTRLQ